MILRVYQKSQIFTMELTKSVIIQIKWALLIHIIFSFITFSRPNILYSVSFDYGLEIEQEEEKFLERFSGSSLQHLHIIISIIGSIALILLLIFEDLIVGIVSSLTKFCKKTCRSKKIKTGPRKNSWDKSKEELDSSPIDKSSKNLNEDNSSEENRVDDNESDRDPEVAVKNSKKSKLKYSVTSTKTMPMYEGGYSLSSQNGDLKLEGGSA